MSDDPQEKYLDEFEASSGFATAFESFLHSQRPLFSLSANHWNPPADVFETPTEVVIKIEVAGMDKEDFEVSIHHNRLSVRGRRDDPDQRGMKCLHQMEVRYGCFERSFDLPTQVDADKIQADYEQGFLRIRVPKRKTPPRKIAVTENSDKTATGKRAKGKE